MRITFSQNTAIWMVAIFALLFPPLFVSPYVINIFVMIFVYAVLAVSWNFLAAYAGQFSFGHQAFYGMGAYASALLVIYGAVPLPISIVAGTLFSGLVGFLVGLVSLRIRGFYLALVTWGLAEIVRLVLTMQYQVTRGLLGLTVPAMFAEVWPFYYVGLAIMIATVWMFYRITKHRVGLMIRAMRDDEDVAESLGVNTTSLKIFAFTLSSMCAGLAGAFWAHFVTVLTPSMASLDVMGAILFSTIIGGFGSFPGPIIGAAMYVVMWEYLREFRTVWLLAFGVLVILIIRFGRGGVYGVIQSRLGHLRPLMLPRSAKKVRAQE